MAANIPSSFESKLFQPYIQAETLPLEIHVKDYIGPGHLCRVIDTAIEGLDLSLFYDYYSTEGRKAYHPKALIKVLLYAYCTKVYTSRPIARRLREDLCFIFLSGGYRPCFKTICSFRVGVFRHALDDIFAHLLLYLLDEGYIDLQDLYCDGSKWAANNNRFKITWAKNTSRYKAAVEARIRSYIEELHELQVAEDLACVDTLLPETGEVLTLLEQNGLNSERLKLFALNAQHVLQHPDTSFVRDTSSLLDAARRVLNALDKEVVKLEKYEEQERILDGRNSYGQTDTDATYMRMKDDRALPAYNVHLSTSNQYVVHYSFSNNSSDMPGFISHVEGLAERASGLGQALGSVTADAGYGSEENYAYLKEAGIDAYVKYPSWQKEQSGELAKDIYNPVNWSFNEVSNTITCPEGQALMCEGEEQVDTANGYTRTLQKYTCANCANCSVRNLCMGDKEGMKQVKRSAEGEQFKDEARILLKSEKGKAKRKKRNFDVEPVFGDLKYNQKHDRFILRGQEKVNVEIGLLVMAHNLRKVHCDKAGVWRAKHAQEQEKHSNKDEKRA